MSRSKREIPHYHLTNEIDLSAALEWLGQMNENRPVDQRILPAAMFVKVTAMAAAEHPSFNGWWHNGGFEPAATVRVGVITSLRDGGLVAPVLADADRKDLSAVMTELRDLIGRARGNRLRSSEVSEATISVTNLGDRGVDAVHGVIHPPQVALVGFGRVRDRPVAVGSSVEIRPSVTATLAGDHRASDGHAGARFLASVESVLQTPEAL